MTFIERTLTRMAKALSHALVSERVAAQRGLVQSLDVRIALASTIIFVIAAVLVEDLKVLAVLLAVSVLVALLSRMPLKTLTLRVWFFPLLFTLTIALPAIFVTRGIPVAAVGGLQITEQGLRTVALLLLRVTTAVTFTATLAIATHWNELLKALRFFRVPREVIMMISMTHRYVFLLVETAVQMFESRRSRIVGELNRNEQRQLATRTGGVLLTKSIALSSEVFSAMQSRGFTGEIRTLEHKRLGAVDVIAAVCAVSISAGAVILGI